MHLQIGPVSLAPFERTADLVIKPRMDDTGLDLLYYEVSGAMECTWSPYATATATAPVAPAPGDALGITVRNLRSVLMQPKQQITLAIGPDRCFTSPLSGPFAVGLVLPCDLMGGPFVDEVQVLDILGDYTATVLVRFRFAYNDDNHIVLSNRWTVRCKTDATSWLTTRTTTGIAQLRMDFLQTLNSANLNPTIVPDQFRRAFILPCPSGFMRKVVEVVAEPDGAKLQYTVVDQQMRLNLGTGSNITKLHGDVTGGVDFPFKSLQGGWIGSIGLASLALGQNVAEEATRMAKWWAGAFTTPKAKVVVQVTGNHQATLLELATFASQVALDRLSPLVFEKQLIYISSYLTSTFDAEGAPMVQLAIEVLPLGLAALSAIQNPAKPSALMNLLADISGVLIPGHPVTKLASTDPAFGNPRLPASDNTRGSYVAFMVSQVLATGSVAAGNYVPVGGTPGDGVPARDELGLS